MRRWWLALLLVLPGCLLVWSRRSEAPSLLTDTDTRVLLAKLAERQNPLSWFGGDWPLENHFYRPIATLVFEADRALYGQDAAGYGRTNALLCILAALALFWFLRELSDSPGVSVAGTTLFAAWTVDDGYQLSQVVGYAVWLIPVAASLRLWQTLGHPDRGARPPWPAAVGTVVLAWLAARFLVAELDGVAPLWMRNVAWLPGRTATTMTVFALGSLAAYARFERLRDQGRTPPPDATSLVGLRATDAPNTKSARFAAPSRHGWAWAALATFLLAAALASYEQAIMVPGCMVAVAVAFHLRGARPQWGWQIAFWGVLVAYLVLRHRLVPTEASAYQRQQFRASGSVGLAILDYLFPEGAYLPIILNSLELGWETLLVGGVAVGALVGVAANLAGYWALRRRWVLGCGALAMSVLAYLPMAWLKPFDHYHFWPMAMRSAYVVFLAIGVGEAVASALSPPTRQAPLRPRPAPGSLLRR